MKQVTLYTVESKIITVHGDVNNINIHQTINGLGDLVPTLDGDMVSKREVKRISIPVRHIRRLNGRDLIAVDPELEDLLTSDLRNQLKREIGEHKWTGSVLNKTIEHSEQLLTRIEKFTALPWYARIWRSITCNI